MENMKKYRDFVRSLSSNKINKIFLNSDEDKMLTVFTEMFRRSKNEFRIFAASLCNKSTDSDEYVETLSDFIENKGKLRILLNRFDEEKALVSSLFQRLAYYKNLGFDIEVKKTSAEPYIVENDKQIKVHIAIGDHESYRIETDIMNRTAICNMTDPEKAQELVVFFDRLFNSKSSEIISLTSLFEFE